MVGERESDIKIPTDTPYLTLTGELCAGLQGKPFKPFLIFF